MQVSFSFIIPVYNRPQEIEELLDSLFAQTFSQPFEIVVVEDGSTLTSEEVIDVYRGRLNNRPHISLTYFKKENTGPGSSRNYGMQRAQGNYFIILDSDCILPDDYLKTVSDSLSREFVHCYGGPDAAHASFTPIQKAINYTMTSVLTTGGVRGKTASSKNSEGEQSVAEDSLKKYPSEKHSGETHHSESHPGTGHPKGKHPTKNKPLTGQFQPRSFNMGLSKEIFEATGGFGNIHPGEDPDLTFRIWEKGYPTKQFPEAFVYHKRRIDLQKFFVQVKKFGMVRPILNRRYPKMKKMAYWFPTLFCLGFVAALILGFLGIKLPLFFYLLYFVLLFVDSLLKNRSLSIALLSLVAAGVQFTGYGYGFLKSTIFLTFSNRKAEELFPELFFNSTATA